MSDNTRIYKMEFFKDFVGDVNEFQTFLNNLENGNAGLQYGSAEQQRKLFDAINKGFTIIHPAATTNDLDELGTYIYVNGVYFKTKFDAQSLAGNNFWTCWTINGGWRDNQPITFYKKGYDNEDLAKQESGQIIGSVIFDENHQAIFVDGKKYSSASSGTLIPTMEVKEMYIVGGQYGDYDRIILNLTTRQKFVPGGEHPDTKIDFTYPVLQELTDDNGLITIFDNNESNWCPAVISFPEGPDYSAWESNAKLVIEAQGDTDNVSIPLIYFDNTGTSHDIFSDQVHPNQTILFGLFLDGPNKKCFVCLNAGNAGAQGVQGYEGPMGPAGEDGSQGIQGYTGANGEQGQDGSQGIQGLQGPAGENGEQGQDGSQGADGTQGYTGAQGTAGIEGEKGLQGADGTQGIQGYTGAQGTAGIEGEKGLQGADGSQGIQGIQGIIGLQGPAGEASSQGADGSQGYTGSQGLQGYKGQDGTTGLQGADGSQGYTGSQGLQGYKGQDGTTGLQGNDGSQGTQGYAGQDGTTGLQGADGSQGVQGYAGQDGTTGLQGADGSQGIQGIQGIIGLQGPAGEASSQGADGSQGYTGSQGIQGIQGNFGENGDRGSIFWETEHSTPSTNTDINKTNVDDITGFTVQVGDYLLCTYDGPTQGNLFRITSIGNTVYGLEFITNIRGAQGIQGYAGSQGTQGIQGIQGKTGSQGIQGLQGYKGQDGTTGLQGADGSQGVQGIQGKTGTQGIQGIQGKTGSQGIQGIQGTQGIQGLQGNSGNRGSITWYTDHTLSTIQGSITPSDITPITGFTPRVNDYLLCTTNGNLFRLTNINLSDTIAYITNIRGPQGTDGTQGIQGLQGPAGSGGSSDTLQLIFYDYTGVTDNSYTFLVQ